ncbi:MAG: PKD domain-containing protein [Bacteroidia bacterium]|nr:PKD domain-containing protein [Bacteroidia bacterium]
MKKLILILLGSIALVQVSQAQITYSSSEYASVGDTFVMSTVQNGLIGLNVAATGPNFNWVFDSLEVSDQRRFRIEDPDNTGYFLTWFAACILGQGNVFTCPGIWDNLTDQAISDGADFGFGGVQFSNAFTFYKKTSSTYEATIFGASIGIGGISLPIAVNYEDIDTLYQFPLVYQNIDSSFSRLAFDASNGGTGIESIQEHKRINEIDGWGSLTTPFATYDSVLRMKTTLFNNDTIVVNGMSIAVPTTTIEYKWFAKDTGQPAMVATLNRLPIGGDVLTSIEFIDSLKCLQPNASFLFFPPIAPIDSASGVANVSFFNQSGNSDQFSWDFGDGTSSTDENPSHSFAPGIYNVRLIACNSICNPLLCDTFSLPVTVINQFAPIAVVSSGPNSFCDKETVTFVNNSINAQSHFWDFGDGNTSTDREPTHLYAQPDTYQYRYIAINGIYRDTIDGEAIVLELPNPDLGLDTLQLFTNSDTSLSPGNFPFYEWYTGDNADTLFLDGAIIGLGTLDVWVDVVDLNGCRNRDSVVVIVSFPVNVAEAIFSQVEIFPNPSNGLVSISIPQEFGTSATIQLLDLNGKTLLSDEIKAGNQKTISMNGLNKGFYMLHLKSEKFSITRKLLLAE